MKFILVPTDFSENAYNALEYASYIALKSKAEVLVLNAFRNPSETANIMINFADILEKDSKISIAGMINKVSDNEKFEDIKYTPLSCYGFLAESINQVAKRYDIDLIIMGASGASNLRSQILGSNTLTVIRKIELPTIIVPHGFKFLEWKDIIIASNQKNDLPRAIEELKPLVQADNISVNFLSIEESISKNEVQSDSELIKSLNGWQYKFTTENNENVADGILDYVKNHNSDIIVLLRKEYSFLKKLLKRSVSKKMAISSNKPLLFFKT